MADIKYDIVEEIGVISENAKGWRKELNKISCINVQGLGFRKLLIAAKDYSGYQLKVMLNVPDKKPQ